MSEHIKYWHIENKDLIKDAEESSDDELVYDVILNLNWECCELLSRIQELEKQNRDSKEAYQNLLAEMRDLGLYEDE